MEEGTSITVGWRQTYGQIGWKEDIPMWKGGRGFWALRDITKDGKE